MKKILNVFLFRRKWFTLRGDLNRKDMDKITIVMSQREYKKFLAYKEADKIVRSIRRGFQEVQDVRNGKCQLKSAYELAHEL